jgi:hypothetical protein
MVFYIKKPICFGGYFGYEHEKTTTSYETCIHRDFEYLGSMDMYMRYSSILLRCWYEICI